MPLTSASRRRPVDGVARLRPVQNDRRHIAVMFDAHMLSPIISSPIFHKLVIARAGGKQCRSGSGAESFVLNESD